VKSKHRVMGILVLSIILSVFAAVPIKSYTARLQYKINNYLPNNLYVENIHLGGKTLEQAKDEIDKLEKIQLKRTITIQYGDGNGNDYYQGNTFTYAQLGYYIDKTSATSQINAVMNKNNSFFKRYLNYRKIEKSRVDLLLSYNIHYDQFLKALEIYDDSNLKPPINAKYNIIDGKVQIVKEENGYAFDKDELYKYLLAKRDLKTAKLKVKAVKASVTAAQLETQGIKELLISFTTKFDAGNVPRSSNIRLAASIIDGTLLPPGATFSFNDIVGKRTEERGFKEAGVYINGKVDTGIGGGICQVSTTLYNAVLLVDLQVIERSNHSLTVPYVPLSRDAAVSWGSQDLKFSNNTVNHILVKTKTTRDSITFELYSTKTNKTVELISTTLSKNKAPIQYIDDVAAFIGSEAVVEKGHDGYLSQLIKNVYVDGVKISTELVSKDRYLSEVKIIRRGTRLPDVYLDEKSEI